MNKIVINDRYIFLKYVSKVLVRDIRFLRIPHSYAPLLFSQRCNRMYQITVIFCTVSKNIFFNF